MAGDFNYGNVLAISGGFLSAGADFYSAYTALRTSKYASDILKYQASYIDAVTELEITKKKRELKKIIGSQRARTAAANIMPDVGTPMELQIESEILNEIDIALLRISGNMQKVGFHGQANTSRIKGYGEASGYLSRGAATFTDSLITQLKRKPPKQREPEAPKDKRGGR